jgi:hypothetical protein
MRAPLVLFFLAGTAWGCTCSVSPAGNPPCQSAWNHAAVFTGMVLDVTDPPLTDSSRRKVRFRIAESFHGLAPDQQEVAVETGRGGGDCGYAFIRGRDYIVYIWKTPDGALTTGICSPTKPLENAAEDLAYFHQLPKLPPTAEVRVTAYDVHGGFNPLRGLAGVRVTLQGSGGERTAVTNADGRHIFAGLPPGEYRVAGSLESYVGPDQVRPAKVHAKGCAEVPLPMRLDRKVTGRVVHKDGSPAVGVTVEAVAKSRPQSPADSDTTDADGRYELPRLGAGEYFLGVSISRPPDLKNPYTRWFHPGTEDPARAGVVLVSDTPGVLRFDLTLPDPQRERVIRGVLLWPDGRAASGARIWLADPRWPGRTVGYGAMTDSYGRFTLQGLDRTRYVVSATTLGANSVSAEQPVEPGSDPAELRLVLTRPGR